MKIEWNTKRVSNDNRYFGGMEYSCMGFLFISTRQNSACFQCFFFFSLVFVFFHFPYVSYLFLPSNDMSSFWVFYFLPDICLASPRHSTVNIIILMIFKGSESSSVSFVRSKSQVFQNFYWRKEYDTKRKMQKKMPSASSRILDFHETLLLREKIPKWIASFNNSHSSSSFSLFCASCQFCIWKEENVIQLSQLSQYNNSNMNKLSLNFIFIRFNYSNWMEKKSLKKSICCRS